MEKYNFTYRTLFICMLFVSFILSNGCDDDAVKYNLSVQLNLTLNDAVVNIGDSIELNGKKAVVSMANFYISNFAVQNNSETKVISDVFLYRIGETESMPLVVEDIKEINSILFNIGVSEAINEEGPMNYEPDHPLGLNNSDMQWSWSVGYIFFRIQGVYDLNNNGIENNDFFLYHVGLNKNYIDIKIDRSITLNENENTLVPVSIDIEKLLSGVDSIDDLTSHSEESKSVITEKIKNNLIEALK